MSTSKSKRGARWLLPRLALALLAALISLAAVEGGARLYLGNAFVQDLPIGRPDRACAQPDPVLGWSNLPNARARVDAPRFSYWLQINSRGLRDTEHTFQKKPGTLRIALLGDSLAWGWGVDNGKAFADIVERDLGPDVEVINFGVPGYSTDQELLAFERDGVNYEPDLVLLCFVLNDVVGNHQRESQGRFKPHLERRGAEWVMAPCPPPRPVTDKLREFSTPEWLYWHSAVLQAANPPDGEKQLASEASRVTGGADTEGPDRDAPLPDRSAEDDQIKALCEEVADESSPSYALLGKLSEACRSRKLPLVAFSIAHHHDKYLYWVDVPRPTPAGPELRTLLTERLADAGRRLGFQTFSVDQAMFEETGKGHVLTCGDSHLNELGNQVVARRIVEELRPLLAKIRGGGDPAAIPPVR
ncbi:MAG TPA: SGNH/GDSL hydrolase family protein [Planctomycetota bacterium]|nr:SGNH/GDSL hydrolase family protein [Planctomycetota bacterium]